MELAVLLQPASQHCLTLVIRNVQRFMPRWLIGCLGQEICRERTAESHAAPAPLTAIQQQQQHAPHLNDGVPIVDELARVVTERRLLNLAHASIVSRAHGQACGASAGAEEA